MTPELSEPIHLEFLIASAARCPISVPIVRDSVLVEGALWRMCGHPAVQQALRNDYFESRCLCKRPMLCPVHYKCTVIHE